MSENKRQQWLTRQEICEQENITKYSLYQLIKTGEIEKKQDGKRVLYFRKLSESSENKNPIFELLKSERERADQAEKDAKQFLQNLIQAQEQHHQLEIGKLKAESEIEIEKARSKELRIQLNELQKERDNLKLEMEMEKKKSFWQRLFGVKK